jgi:murein DD-endopeptidase MepM/ murein hydrolase activator NlpD
MPTKQHKKLALAITCSQILALSAAAAPQRAIEATAPSATLEDPFDLAREATANGDIDQAVEWLRIIEVIASNPFDAWAAVSAQVALYRESGRFDHADAVTSRMADQRPEAAGLMVLWAGDTAAFAGRYHDALAKYTEVADGKEAGQQQIRAQALKQAARLHAAHGRYGAAAVIFRALLQTHNQRVDPRWAMGQALLNEALERSGAPEGFQDPDRHWIVALERIHTAGTNGGAAEGDDLGVEGLRFQLSQDDRNLLRKAQRDRQTQAVQVAATTTAACAPPVAWSGFQLPFEPNRSNYGYRYMEYPDSTGGYHPGVDLNWGWGADDANLDFAVVADGCVTDSPGANVKPTTWGSATVQHNFVRIWTSQYGHADKVYYSYGAAVKKGWKLGNVGDIGSPGAYHLHFEIREQDHPSATDVDAYPNNSKTLVGDYYQDPESFIVAHPASSYYQWFDQGAWTFFGSWTTKTGIGNEDNLRYAATTSSSTKSNYATRNFTVPSSGTYRLFVFVPWNYSTSTKAPYRIIDTASGSVVKTATLNQNVLMDAWASLGTMSMAAGKTYRIEVATNTGETGKQVALDDVLILR